MDSNTLYVSITDEKRGIKGFLDDYAFAILALISLYQPTFKDAYLQQALALNEKIIAEFYGENKGGFYLYAKESEQLILRPKESYDGEMPSGNSVMAYNLIRLAKLTKDDKLDMHCTTTIYAKTGQRLSIWLWFFSICNTSYQRISTAQ